MERADRINLLGEDLETLKKLFSAHGLTELDAKRVFPWIHRKGARTFDEMSDVPLVVREKLKEDFSLSRGYCVTMLTSKDGTRKALLEFADGARVETVFIPDEGRNTICVSSQVGCPMKCKFCHTGTQGFVRNLTAAEIMAQVMFWKDQFPVTNIVFMGMGEPLLNAKNLFAVLSLLLDEKTHNFSRKKITVSTCGVPTKDLNNLAVFGVKLAISLHASNDDIRSFLMPVNQSFKMKPLLSAARKYKVKSNSEKVTFEYLLLKNINDSAADADRLIQLFKNFPAKVNLIVYNDWPNSPFIGSGREKADWFAQRLIQNGVRATIRKSRGDDILAACGQLKSTATQQP